MKKKFFSLVAVCLLLTFNSCRKALKDESDYFPKVTTVSVVPQNDGTLLLTGTIDSPGAADVEYAGFCYSTGSIPKMLDNQVIGTVSGNTVTASLQCSSFSIDSIYHFRTWATNAYGYVYGNILAVDSIVTPTVTAPCSHPVNTVNIGASTGTHNYSSVDVPTNNMGEWTFTGYTSTGPEVTYTFGSSLSTGIYTTTLNTSPGAGQVYVSFIDGFISGALNSGTSVYVNTIGPNTYDIAICNAPWVYNSVTNYFY